ncbi:MAG TPA: LytR C-terminal domain-containing protein [Actinomycetota bacterium]|nr:LytR C-terminal domain-containing protein [Actinomycetota bacterium]
MTRRLSILLFVAVLATAGTGAMLIVRERAGSSPQPVTPTATGLALVTVATHDALLPALVGSTGSGKAGAVVVPPSTMVVIPGQGESTVGDALQLEPRAAATAVSNLLGVWIAHSATVEADRVAAVADATGIEIDGDHAGATEVTSMLDEPDPGGAAALQIVLKALAQGGASWDVGDLTEAHGGGQVVDALSAVRGSNVVTLQTYEVAAGVFRATPEQVTQALVAAFGGPAEAATPVIVLNGNGIPGIGERVAERLIPGGFRVAVSQNASEFHHPETLIVVGSPDDVGLAERVRDLLGVGSVSVSVGSGIAPVTVVVGEDFSG